MQDVLVMNNGSIWKVPTDQFAAYLRHRRGGYAGVKLDHYGVIVGTKVVDLTNADEIEIAQLCQEYWP